MPLGESKFYKNKPPASIRKRQLLRIDNAYLVYYANNMQLYIVLCNKKAFIKKCFFFYILSCIIHKKTRYFLSRFF